MNARTDILARLRTAAGGRAASSKASEMAPHASAYRMPADRDGLVAMFALQARKSAAEVRRTDSRQAIEAALRELRAAQPLTTSDLQLAAEHPLLAPADTGMDARCRVVRATAGIAETGTVCVAGSRTITRELFLCEHLVVLLRAEDILYCQEQYWQRAPSTVPQALHLVSGPSRTADVEQTLQIGAHGPRAVTILLASESPVNLPAG